MVTTRMHARRRNAAAAVIALSVLSLPACRGGDTTTPVLSATDQAYAAVLQATDALRADLIASPWPELGADGVGGAFWLVDRARAMGGLMSGLGSNRPSYLVLLGELEASLNRVARIRRTAAPQYAAELDGVAEKLRALRAVLTTEIEPALPGPSESDPALRTAFETSTSFSGFGIGLVPTEATPPVLAVGDFEADGFCVDEQDAQASGLLVRVTDASTDQTLGEGTGQATATLDRPTWVAASIVDADGAVRDLATCELAMMGTRVGVAGTPVSADRVASLEQALDSLAAHLLQDEDAFRSVRAVAADPGTLQLYQELGYALDARLRIVHHLRWLISFQKLDSDDKQVAEISHGQDESTYQDALDEAKDAYDDAKDAYHDALDALQKHNDEEAQVFQTLPPP